MVQQDCRRKVRRRTRSHQFEAGFDMIRPDELRKDLCAEPRFMEHANTVCRLAFRQNSDQLLPDPFAAYLMNARGHFAHRVPGGRLYGVTQPRAEANGAKDSKFIFLEPRMRIADGSH